MAAKSSSRRRVVTASVALCAVLSVLASSPARAGIDGEIIYGRSTDGGASFGEFANLSGDPDASLLPQVAADSGSVHVVWRTNDKAGDVVHRRSGDGGTRFGPAVNLNGTDTDASEPSVAVAGGNVAVVWAEILLDKSNQPDPTVKADEVYGRRSTSGGQKFDKRVNISASREEHTRDPHIVAHDDLMVLVYEDRVGEQTKGVGNEEIFLRRSTDGAKKWSKPVNLSREPSEQVESAAAVSGTDVHVVWEHRGARDDITDDRVGYVRSTDGGASFSDGVFLPSEVPTRKPSVAASGQVVHVVSCIRSDKSGLYDSDVVYHRSTDRGATWDPPVVVSATDGNCGAPVVRAHGDQVYIAWSDTTPRRSDIHLRRSGDSGASFESLQNVSNSRGSSEEAWLAVDASTGALHLVWRDFSIDTPPVAARAAALPADPSPAATLRTRATRRRRPSRVMAAGSGASKRCLSPPGR